MKLRFEVDQADSFRRGIDRPKSIVSIEINPADVPEDVRAFIADHLAGIDVLQFFYHNGEVIKGHPIGELACTSREPKRIVARAANIEALVDAIKANDKLITSIKASFNRPVQFRIIDKPPRNESEFAVVSDQLPDQMEKIGEAITRRQRIFFDCFLDDVQKRLNQILNEYSYVVCLLPLLPHTARARFYCEPVYAATFLGRTVAASSPIIVLNEKTGRIVEAKNLFHALDIYLVSGVMVNDLSILTWENGKWIIVAPEGLITIANEASRRPTPEAAAA